MFGLNFPTAVMLTPITGSLFVLDRFRRATDHMAIRLPFVDASVLLCTLVFVCWCRPVQEHRFFFLYFLSRGDENTCLPEADSHATIYSM